ncbi:MAG: type VI secretion system tip protein TssI/VgrG [Polyangiaceae bacterium]
MTAFATVELVLDREPACAFQILRARVHEHVSRPIHAEVDLVVAEREDISSWVGHEARLSGAAFGERRELRLVVGRVTVVGDPLDRDRAHRGLTYRLELHSPSWLLGHRTDTRKYRNLSTREIVSRVLEEHGVEHRYSLGRPTQTHKYCLAYDETDLAFIERLLAFEGIHFCAEDDGSLSIADESGSSADCAVGVRVATTSLVHEERSITRLRERRSVRPTRYTVSDYDWKRPTLVLERTAESAPGAQRPSLEVYEHHTGYRDPDQGAYLAKVRLERERVTAHVFEGESTEVQFKAGKRMSIDPGLHQGAWATSRETDLFLIEVRHDWTVDAAERDAAPAYANRFVAIPSTVPYRPPATPRPVVKGHETVRVRGPAGSEIHCDVHGRFKAQFHWDRFANQTDADSRWLRLTQEAATSLFLARVGWEMMVVHIDGDPNRPIGLGRVINGVMPAAYGQPAFKEAMSIKTPSSPAGTGGFNEWRMNDAAGVMAIDLHAEQAFMTHANHDQVESVGRDEVRVTQGGTARTVLANQTVTINNNDELQVGGPIDRTIGGNLARTVGAAEHISAGGALTERTTGDDSESVAGLRLTIAGGVHVPSVKDTLAGVVELEKSAMASLGQLQGLPTSLGKAGPSLSRPAPPPISSMAKSVLPPMPSLTGSIHRQATDSGRRVVGGAEVAVAGSTIGLAAEGGLQRVVGGAHFIDAKGGHVNLRGKTVSLSTGVSLTRKATFDLSLQAKRSTLNVGGSATIDATKEVAIRASKIRIETSSKLTISAKGAGLQLDTGGVTLQGDLGLDPTAVLSMTGAPDDLAR